MREVVAEMSFGQQRAFGLQVIKGVAVSEQFEKGFQEAAKWLRALTD